VSWYWSAAKERGELMDWFALVCVGAFHDQKAVFHKQLNAGVNPRSLMAGVLPFLRQFNDY